jgi:DNA-binding NtrC family response regulator
MNLRNTENRGTILIADDDSAVLILIKTILTAAGYRVVLAAEGADAIHLARQKHLRIDLALLDIRMPGIHGTQLADEILSVRPNARVLFMSGYVDEEIIRIKMLDEYAGFLPKPFKTADLLESVRTALESPASMPAPESSVEA